MSDEGHFKCRTVLALYESEIASLKTLVREVYVEMRGCLAQAEDSSSYYGGGGDEEVAERLKELEKRIDAATAQHSQPHREGR